MIEELNDHRGPLNQRLGDWPGWVGLTVADCWQDAMNR